MFLHHQGSLQRRGRADAGTRRHPFWPHAKPGLRRARSDIGMPRRCGKENTMGDLDRLSAAMLGLAAGALLVTAGPVSAQTAVPPQQQERLEQATPPHAPRDTSARTLTDHDRACERGDGLSCQEGGKIRAKITAGGGSALVPPPPSTATGGGGAQNR
jgi:hypothetical protein